MMTSSPELSFDFKPVHSYSMLLESSGEHTTEQTQQLEEFLARLEQERLKIEAFKRELPLCMQLLTNAMETSRQELQSQRTNQGAISPILEEFIPLKNTSSSQVTENHATNISADKANWMTSAQLWSQQTEETNFQLALNAKQGINRGGAFLPFSSSKDRSAAFPELALASSHKEQIEDKKNSFENVSSVAEKDHVCGTANTTQAQRKARRCWSPDLHRRFVNALHMLGGSQVATPRQIRELMKVDGLTNDEVKSHLQKYRLHTRTPTPSQQAAFPGGSQLVVLGGIWVPPEYAAHGGAPAAALYGAHAAATRKASPSFCSGSPPVVPQEFYHAIAPPPPPPSKNQMHHRPIDHQYFHVYNKSTLTQGISSLDSLRRSAGDHPSESIEDEKSQSSSSKADRAYENIGAKVCI